MYVYLIHQTESAYIKIGIADDPNDRLRQLQIGNPQLLYIAYLIECSNRDSAIRVEHALHAIFAKKRIHGEWFDLGVTHAIKTVNAILKMRESIISTHQFALKEMSPVLDHTALHKGEAKAKLEALFQADPQSVDFPVEDLMRLTGAKKSAVYDWRARYKKPIPVSPNGHGKE